MKKTAFLAMVVAFVICSGGAAIAGAFGNESLYVTEDQKLIFQAAGLNGEAQIRIQLGEIPVPRQALAPSAPVANSVTAPVAQAPVNYQLQQPIVDPFGPVVQAAPPVMPPTQMARPPVSLPAVQPRQPEAKVASAPPVKPAAPAVANPAPAKPATPVAAAPAKPAVPVKQEQLAKASTAPVSGEVRQLYHLKVPIEKVPPENRVINGKQYRPGDTLYMVTEEINGKSDPSKIYFTETPPANSKLETYKGGGRS